MIQVLWRGYQCLRGDCRWKATATTETDAQREVEDHVRLQHGAHIEPQFSFACENCSALEAQVRGLTAQVEHEQALSERLRQEARIHAQEARTQQATVHDCYAVVGAQVCDWHGAEPVRQHVEELRARLAAQAEEIAAMADLRDQLQQALSVTHHLHEAAKAENTRLRTAALSRKAE